MTHSSIRIDRLNRNDRAQNGLSGDGCRLPQNDLVDSDTEVLN